MILRSTDRERESKSGNKGKPRLVTNQQVTTGATEAQSYAGNHTFNHVSVVLLEWGEEAGVFPLIPISY